MGSGWDNKVIHACAILRLSKDINLVNNVDNNVHFAVCHY